MCVYGERGIRKAKREGFCLFVCFKKGPDHEAVRTFFPEINRWPLQGFKRAIIVLFTFVFQSGGSGRQSERPGER